MAVGPWLTAGRLLGGQPGRLTLRRAGSSPVSPADQSDASMRVLAALRSNSRATDLQMLAGASLAGAATVPGSAPARVCQET